MIQQFDDTSRALVDAAHRVLETDGPDGLTVRRIAAAAGVSTMNLYSRFDGKHGVINELYATGHRKLAARLGAVPRTDDVVTDVLAILREYREFSIEYRSYYRVMFETSTASNFRPTDAAIAVADQSLDLLAERLQAAYDDGQLSPIDGWTASKAAAWLWSVAHGSVSLEVYGTGTDRIDWSELFTTGLEVAFAGLANH